MARLQEELAGLRLTAIAAAMLAGIIIGHRRAGR
jgi:hypothetical protein